MKIHRAKNGIPRIGKVNFKRNPSITDKTDQLESIILFLIISLGFISLASVFVQLIYLMFT